MLTRWYPAEKLSLHTIASRKLFVLIAACSRYSNILESFPAGNHPGSILRWTKNFVCGCQNVWKKFVFYLTGLLNHVFVIVKMNAFGIDIGRLVRVLGLFYILNIGDQATGRPGRNSPLVGSNFSLF